MTTGNGELSNAADPQLTKVKRLKGAPDKLNVTPCFASDMVLEV
jgi:hypothetical protein